MNQVLAHLGCPGVSAIKWVWYWFLEWFDFRPVPLNMNRAWLLVQFLCYVPFLSKTTSVKPLMC